MNYENSLKEIISNHLAQEELASFNLNEINLSYGIDFYDAKMEFLESSLWMV